MEHPFTFFERFIPGVNHENLHVVTTCFVLLVLVGGVFLLYPRLRNASENVLPDSEISLKALFEIFLSMLTGLCEDMIGHGGKKYLPFVGSVFFFIFVSNLVGLIPGFLPPTENWVTGAAVATISFIAYNYFGFKEHGVGYFKHFLAPVSGGVTKSFIQWVLIMLPLCLFHVLFAGIELLSSFFRPITLSIRLYANIFADHMVLGIFSGLVPYLIPLPFMALGVFVAFIQAFIFTLLTTVYISGAVAHEH